MFYEYHWKMEQIEESRESRNSMKRKKFVIVIFFTCLMIYILKKTNAHSLANGIYYKKFNKQQKNCILIRKKIKTQENLQKFE